MTQKMNTFCLSTHFQETRKVTAIDRSRLMNRQGKCMPLLITHQLNTKVVHTGKKNQGLSSDGTGHCLGSQNMGQECTIFERKYH